MGCRLRSALTRMGRTTAVGFYCCCLEFYDHEYSLLPALPFDVSTSSATGCAFWSRIRKTKVRLETLRTSLNFIKVEKLSTSSNLATTLAPPGFSSLYP